MAKVGVVYHPKRESACAKAIELEAWLRDNDHRAIFLGEEVIPDDLDLVVSLGGDGTMLRAIDRVLPSVTPVLGVNFGSLGYLTEVDPDGLFGALEDFFKGNFLIEQRMMLSIAVVRGKGHLDTEELWNYESPDVETYAALNELVVEKLHSGHVIRIGAYIGLEEFLIYEADGLIVSTPTGSTAYSFSARGPVVSPRLRAVVLTPISPHMLFDRSLVLEPTEAVGLKLCEGPSAAVMVDGVHKATIEPGDYVRCLANDTPAHLVTFSHRDFHQILKKKFGLVSKPMGE